MHLTTGWLTNLSAFHWPLGASEGQPDVCIAVRDSSEGHRTLLSPSGGGYPPWVAKDDPRPSEEPSLDSASWARRDEVISASPCGHALLHDAGATDSASALSGLPDFSIAKRLVSSGPDADSASHDRRRLLCGRHLN